MARGVPHTRSTHILDLPADYPPRPPRRDLLAHETDSPFAWSVLEALLLKARRAAKPDSDLDDDMSIINPSAKGKRKASSPVREDARARGGPSKRVKVEEASSPPSSSFRARPTAGPSSSWRGEPIDLDSSDEDDKQLSPPIVIAPAQPGTPILYHTLVQTPAVPPPAEPLHHYRLPANKEPDLISLRARLADQLAAKTRFLALLDRYDEHHVGEEEINLGEVHLFPLDGRAALLTRPPPPEMSSTKLKAADKKLIDPTRIMDCLYEPEAALADKLEEADLPAGRGEKPWTWLESLAVLSSGASPRLSVSANLCVVRLAPSADTLPFSLVVRFKVSIPSGSVASICPPDTIEDQRLFWTTLLPAVPKPAQFDTHGSTTLPFFYDVLLPAPPFETGEKDEAAQPKGLRPTLHPFQRRSTRWLLEREGKRFLEDGKVVDISNRSSGIVGWEQVTLPLSGVPPLGELVERVETAEVMPSLWFDRLMGTVGMTETDVRASGSFLDLVSVRGGMLCEEMGLGKTLEVISLILLNPCDPKSLGGPYASKLDVAVKPTKATLIVAPPTLTQQWVDEIARHSPSLKVLVYAGYKTLPFRVVTGKVDPSAARAKQRGFSKAPVKNRRVVDSDDSSADEEVPEYGEASWWNYLEQNGYDVLITTYATLQADLGVAKPPPSRPRRETVEYSEHERPRSPLVTSEWHRVVMDEVQLQGNGTIAEMVSLLPRRSSLAVSGTPAKNAVKDLQQSLRFLRVPFLATNAKLWSRVLEPGFASIFEQIFRVLATRTTKERVANETQIPAQRRLLFPIDLNGVEILSYQDAYARVHEDLDPAALDLVEARSWLFNLRQIATHLQVGQLGQGGGRVGGAARREGRGRINLGNDLLSVKEVLEKMLEDVESDLANANRAQLASKVTHGLLLVLKSELLPLAAAENTLAARQLYDDVLARVTPLIGPLEKQVADLDAERAALVAEHQAEMRRRASASVSDDSSDSDEVAEAIPLTKEQRVRATRLTTLKARLRELHEVKHRVVFFLGDWHHVAGDAVLEAAMYAEAEALRKTVLREPESTANAALDHMRSKLAKTDVDQAELEVDYCAKGGLLTTDICQRADEVIDLLNDNRELVWNWRGKIFTLLGSPLDTTGDKDEGADGEEYNRALDEQAEVEAYLQAYVSALADRREMLLENRTALAQADAREVKHRGTNRAKEATLAGLELGLYLPGEVKGLKDQLMNARAAVRLNPPKAKKGTVARVCIKSLVLELQEASERAINDAEVQLAETERTRLRRVIKNQETIITKLEGELDVFRQAFNARILFFRSLQALSDSVIAVEVTGLPDLEKKLDECIREEDKLARTIADVSARDRYIQSLRNVYEGEVGEEDRECVICCDDLDEGVIFDCSHILCASCYKAIGTKCPVCRTRIDHDAIHRFRLRQKLADVKPESEDEMDEEVADPKGKGKAKAKPRPSQNKKALDDSNDINHVSRQDRDAIAAIPLFGDWGSKIDMMIKHLLYLRKTDRGSKAVVFSAFPDALVILSRAMNENGIRFVTTGGNKSREVARQFKTDEDIQVFLLHSERESAGLTLTCARYVFLVEPTLSPSFELQAIGRVDRLGQTQQTTVYCYASNQTVDANIVRLSVAKGTSIYLKEAQGKSLALNATRPSEGKVDGEVKKQKTVNADYVAKADDLFSLLFPDRLGLNRNGADIIEISDSDQDAEDDDVASVPRPDNAAGGPRLVVDSDDDEQSEEEVGGGADEEDDDFAKAIAASKAEMDDLRAGSSSAAGPSRSRSRSRK